MLEFLKKTPQKEAVMIAKTYHPTADYGKKTVILSCDLATLGDIGPELKRRGQNKVDKMTPTTRSGRAVRPCLMAGRRAL
ncbi:hypothetical protein [Massilia scottii]|uniref:hypothetical protein n=1 Tax=Massilia scottii TaxID=3057166 RepID=UPI002796C995|nr:hypothetical protein [Massilia sp. CCM 9029]MDQ1831424.1 hypothetical protein [Massilia sp. CCM 9029]